MIILGIDSASISACCGIMKDGIMIAQGFVNNGLTHSQTLLPLIIDTCKQANITPDDIDFICVTKGPGSFTGLRIGLSVAKGIAAKNSTKCVAVSTLEAIAKTCSDKHEGIICAVMDARCKQVYNALFKAENGNLTRLCDDRAIPISDLEKELSKSYEHVILCGDGAKLCENSFESDIGLLAEEEYILPKGNAICALGERYFKNALPPNELTPMYLRLPQAQRELKLKKKEDKKK